MLADQISPFVADLHLLTVLAETRSFTETARRLGISKASASTRITELERATGVSLVRRTTRSVGLTDAGQQLVNEMHPAFSRISESYHAVKDLVGAPRGLIRLTAPVALGRQHLARHVAGFLKRYPDIHIELELTDRFVNLANEGFDLAIRHTSAPPETHVAWALCQTRSILLVSPDYLARRGVPQHPSDLAKHDCLLYLRGNFGNNWTLVRDAKPKTTKTGKPAKQSEKPADRIVVTVAGNLKANNSEVLREALLAGLGIGVLPDFSLRVELEAKSDGEPSALVRVLPDWQVQGVFGDSLYAIRPSSSHVPKAVQLLVEYLRDVFSEGFQAPDIRPDHNARHEYPMETQRHGRSSD